MNIYNISRQIFMGILSIVLLSRGVYADEQLNLQTLCPSEGSKQQTILMIDTTDPLTLVAQEKLKQLLKAFRDSDNQHYLQPGHELIVYRLTPRIENIGKPLRVCNPGNPENRTWKENLTSGKYSGLRKWRRFEQFILRALPRLGEQEEGNKSPLLEAIALVAARHVPSIGVDTQQKSTRLMLFSDMLQNSEHLSHYKLVPDMKSFRSLPGYVEMDSNLSGVDVWLFYVRRSGLEHKQTAEHYYWWTQAIEVFGGHLIEQVPL